MIRKFSNFESALNWAKDIINNGVNDATEVLAEQLYKDSEEFTYQDSRDMYKSGQVNSNFKEGFIIERCPYVRRRYYEGGKPGAGNRNAQPKWFDKTIAKNKQDYKQIIVNSINEAKKE